MDTTPSNNHDHDNGLSVSAPVSPTGAARLRYQREIAAIDGCATIAAKTVPFTKSSYRIVHQEHEDADFHPIAMTSPMRLNKQPPASCCRMWSLSMFESFEQLKAHFEACETHAPKLRKRAGDHSVRLELSAKDGKRLAAGVTGHFSFFEFESFELKQVIKERKPLFEPIDTEDSSGAAAVVK